MQKLLNPTVGLAVALMAVIIMMILPIPAWLLDIGLALSFGLAILIFTITLFIERPLEFSAFPTFLLASLMLRLSLNVSSTKLIIGQGHTGTNAAGGVIEGFADFIMGGSVFLGLVIFSVLIIVNFMVITKGAGRMAEVGARFALDAMPGKQLSIDADLSSGAISHDEAQERRQKEQLETTFFGSLDGASKFVKGDAIAGLLITLLNLIVGFLMGVFAHDLSAGDAIKTYSILTVGDGLVSQIPAVVVSIAAALLLARGGTPGSTDTAVFSQVSQHPQALIAVGLLMALFGVIPGLPFLPFILGAAGLIVGAFWLIGRQNIDSTDETPNEVDVQSPQTLGDILEIDDVHITFAENLVPMVLDQGTGLDIRIENMRRYLAMEYGYLLPKIRLTDEPALHDGEYHISIQGVLTAKGHLSPDDVMILLPDDQHVEIEGQDFDEPVYAAPARWVARDQQDSAHNSGLTCVEPAEILATHVLEVLKNNYANLISLRSLRTMIDEFGSVSDPEKSKSFRKLFDDLIPEKCSHELLLAVLRNLVDEHISIRNLPAIVEAIAESRSQDNQLATEFVRQKLSRQILTKLRADQNVIPLLQLSPEWEEKLNAHQIETADGVLDYALPPEDFSNLARNCRNAVERHAASWANLTLIVPARRRKFLKNVLRAHGDKLPVISFEELGFFKEASIVGTVDA